MKHLTAYIFFSLTLMSTYAQQKTSAKIIFNGSAHNKYDSDTVIMWNHITKDSDTAIVKNGKFKMVVNYNGPTTYYFRSEHQVNLMGGYIPYPVIISKPGTVNIYVDIKDISLSKISGLSDPTLYCDFQKKVKQEDGNIEAELIKEFGKDIVNNPQPDTASIIHRAMMDKYEKLEKAAQKRKIIRLINFIKENSLSYAAVILLSEYKRKMDVSQIESSLNALSGNRYLNTTEEGKGIAPYLTARKVTEIGQTAIDFSTPDTLGNPVTLADFRGKYLLLDFWASWCGPCRAENPYLVQAFNRFKEKGFTILGVSMDGPAGKKAWLTAIRKDGLLWKQASDLNYYESPIAASYGVVSLPTNFLIDPQGVIIAKNLRGKDLENKLEELLVE